MEFLNKKLRVEFLMFTLHMIMGVARAYVAVSTGVPMTTFLQKGSVTGVGLPNPGCTGKTTLPNSFEVSATEHPLVRSYDRTAYIKRMTWFLIQRSTYGPRNWLRVRNNPPFPLGARLGIVPISAGRWARTQALASLGRIDPARTQNL